MDNTMMVELDKFRDTMNSLTKLKGAEYYRAAAAIDRNAIAAIVTQGPQLKQQQQKRTQQKKKLDTEAKKQQEATSIEDKTPETDFYCFYNKMERSFNEYLNRCKAGNNALTIIPTNTIPPWELEKRIDGDLSVQLAEASQANIIDQPVIKECFASFGRYGNSIVSLNMMRLEQDMVRGAILTCLHRALCLTKLMTHKDLCSKLDIGVDCSRKLRAVFALVRTYTLIIYTGVGYTLLYKWRDALQQKFSDEPAEGLRWQGPLDYGQLQRVSQNFDPQQHFLFDTHVYPYGQANNEARAANIIKLTAATSEPPEDNNIKMNDSDSDDYT